MVNQPTEPFGRFDLRDLGVLDAVPNPDFDRAVSLGSRAVRTPVATLAMLDFHAGRSRIIAHVGLVAAAPEVMEIPLESAIALSAMGEGDVLSIPDTARHPRAAGHPFVLAHGIRSLLASPVLCPARDVVGLLAVHDRVPRIWTEAEGKAVAGVAHFCTQAILLRAALRTLAIVSREARPGGVA